MSAAFGPSPRMPSALHELIVALLRDRPGQVVELLAKALGQVLPAFRELDLPSRELPALAVPHQADMVVLLVDEAPVLAVVVEVQLDRDDDKPYTWPLYLTAIRTQYRCPACILVVTPYPGVARWALTPVALGPPDLAFRPIVLGPAAIPLVTHKEPVEPATALLSAVAHAKDKEEEKGVDAAVAALVAASGLDVQTRRIYTDVILAAVGEKARRVLEALMATGNYEYQSEFAKQYIALGRAEGEAKGKVEGKAEGKVEGKAEGVLAVLDARRIAVDPDLRERILGCKDLDLLDRWLRRAATVEKVSQLFN